MKPGSKDKKIDILISGLELEELKKHSWQMSETFGLDGKIIKYRGKRPLGLYRWDFEFLIELIESLLPDKKEYPDSNSIEYKRLNNILKDLTEKYRESFPEFL